jgi:L,D-peptidoglycan transpeptidase YkuD (ErfK/YbiS/YcfS/YnhG family)
MRPKARSMSSPLHVYPNPSDPRTALVTWGMMRLPCRLGRAGVKTDKREGDGATPRGVLRVVKLYYRADQPGPRHSFLPQRVIRPELGWSDDARSFRYNRPIGLPARESHERLWREDRLYDLVIETDWNRRPTVRGRGSAIFIHYVRPDGRPTEGCLAFSKKAMRLLLTKLTPQTRIIIH